MSQGDVVTVAVVLGLVILALATVFYARLRALGRRIGSFECARRTTSGWTSGIAHYGADRVRWYRTMSLSTRPAAEWLRDGLEIVERGVRPGTSGARGSGVLEVTCREDDVTFVLAMSAAAYSGLASWLEAAPPRERMT